jgi:hypothetical protein
MHTNKNKSTHLELEIPQNLDSAVSSIQVAQYLDLILGREPVQMRSVPNKLHCDQGLVVLIILTKDDFPVCTRP